MAVVEPSDVDWPAEDLETVARAAADGIPQAVAELERRVRADDPNPSPTAG